MSNRQAMLESHEPTWTALSGFNPAMDEWKLNQHHHQPGAGTSGPQRPHRFRRKFPAPPTVNQVALRPANPRSARIATNDRAAVR